MNNSLLEMIARQYDNVVQYDADGNPSIFVKIPKMKSSDLDPRLPDHTHPAFIINGVEQDAILIGKFMSAEISAGGPIYSLPNLPPFTDTKITTALEKMRAAGNGASGLTISDHGLLVLLAHKYGWNPHGNSNFGVDSRDAECWYRTSSSVYKVGDVCAFRGWTYECQIEHTASTDLLPSESPNHWKKLKHIGGIPGDPQNYSVNNKFCGRTTLNGSGPLNWYLNSDPGNLCDVVGNRGEILYGMHLCLGEIRILGDNNDAADAGKDCSVNGAWKAILPSKTDNSYTLVEPGTEGTVHYTFQNGRHTLDTIVPGYDSMARLTSFADIAVNTDNMPYVPTILYELGLAPLEGTTVGGSIRIPYTSEKCVFSRGGRSNDPMASGMAALTYVSFTNETTVEGFRARSRV